MKVKYLDDPIVMPDRFTGKSNTVWYDWPVTEEEADDFNAQTESMITSLSSVTEDSVISVVNTLMNRKKSEEVIGKPWTIRQAVISAMFGNDYKRAAKDKQGNVPVEKQEVIGEMQNIGLGFIRALKGGFVTLDGDQLKLVRRKMYELPVPGFVAAIVNEHFDQLEDKRTKTEVVFGIDDEDMEDEDGRQDDASEATEDTEV